MLSPRNTFPQKYGLTKKHVYTTTKTFYHKNMKKLCFDKKKLKQKDFFSQQNMYLPKNTFSQKNIFSSKHVLPKNMFSTKKQV